MFFIHARDSQVKFFKVAYFSKDHIMVSSNLDPRAAIKPLGEVKMWVPRRRAFGMSTLSQRPREIKALEDHGGSGLSLHKDVFLGGGIGEGTIRFP